MLASAKALEKQQGKLDAKPLKVMAVVDDSGVRNLLRLTGKLRQAGGIRIPVALSDIAIGRLKSRINNLSKEVRPFELKLPEGFGKKKIEVPARLRFSTKALTKLRDQEPVSITLGFNSSFSSVVRKASTCRHTSFSSAAVSPQTTKSSM